MQSKNLASSGESVGLWGATSRWRSGNYCSLLKRLPHDLPRGPRLLRRASTLAGSRKRTGKSSYVRRFSKLFHPQAHCRIDSHRLACVHPAGDRPSQTKSRDGRNEWNRGESARVEKQAVHHLREDARHRHSYDDSSENRSHTMLEHKLHHVASVSPECDSESDLHPALQYRIRNYAVDSNRGQQHRGYRKNEEQRRFETTLPRRFSDQIGERADLQNGYFRVRASDSAAKRFAEFVGGGGLDHQFECWQAIAGQQPINRR